VQEYQQAVSWAAQTALRDIIGRTSLTDLLSGRERIEEELQKLIDQRSNPWGVTVQSVEMRDVVIPESLQDAMSREAQASREKAGARHPRPGRSRDRAQLREGGRVVSQQPDGAAPRAMNMLYEGTEGEGGAHAGPELGGRSRWGMGGLMGGGRDAPGRARGLSAADQNRIDWKCGNLEMGESRFPNYNISNFRNFA
jgi:hypothetical protein